MRLLGPSEFGLITMITVFTGFSRVLLNFGFGQAIIQHQDVTKEDLSSVFWVSMSLGLIITLLIMAFSGQIASFYDQPVLQKLTFFIALSYVFNSLGIVHSALLQKELKFKNLAAVSYTHLTLPTICSV